MTEMITTQWGTSVRPFRAYTQAERTHLLTHCKELLAKLKQECGIETFLSYGGLLGAVRQGALISHDFDIDVGFILPHGAREESLPTIKRLVDFLVNNGYHINPESNGHFKAYRHDSEYSIDLEFFAVWMNGSDLFHYFAVRGAAIADAIHPLGEIEIEGVAFPAPHDPEKVLAAIYGPGWRIPDPGFKYSLSAEDWVPFKFLFTNLNQGFWDNYYSNQYQNKVWVETPSDFAEFVRARLIESATLLDIGCGNGRDGLYFASVGHNVTLADYSQNALDVAQESATKRGLVVKTVRLSVSSLPDLVEFKNSRTELFDIVYARFFLHAIDEVSQKNLLDVARQVLKVGGHFALEYRCKGTVAEEFDGNEQHFENGHHYRRMVDVTKFFSQAAEAGFLVSYSYTGQGLAKYKSEDPLINRCILTKSAH